MSTEQMAGAAGDHRLMAMTAPVASPALLAEVLAALVEARDATTHGARRAAYDRLGRHGPFLEWLAERDERGRLATEFYPTVPMHLRDRRVRANSPLERAVFERDGYRCRWCGLPVVSSKTFTEHGLLGSHFDPPVGPDGLRTLGNETTKHVVRFGLVAMADHRKPRSAGGLSTLANLVTSCNPCNCRVRGDATPGCVGLIEQPIEHLAGWPLAVRS